MVGSPEENTIFDRFPADTLQSVVRTMGIVCGCFLFLEILRASLNSSGPTLLLTFHQAVMENHLMSALLGAYVGYMILPGKLSWKVAVTIIGFLVEPQLYSMRADERGMLGAVLLTGIGPGLTALAALALRAALDAEKREVLLRYLVLCSITPFLLMSSGFFHTWNTNLNPIVYDLYSYYIDSAWGFSPPFVVNRLLYKLYIPLGLLSDVVYWELALWMVLSVLACIYMPKYRSYNEAYLTLLVIGLVGALLYGIFPSTGTGVLFGAKFWDTATHFSYHPLPSELELRLLEAPFIHHRNAMPSLHGGWIFVVFLNIRLMPRKVVWIGAFLVTFTLLGALQQGHYLIDFLPSILLAVGSAALTARRGTIPARWRFGASFVCFASAIAYLLLLRYQSQLLIDYFSLNVLSQVGLVALGVFVEWKLVQVYKSGLKSDAAEQ